MPPIKERAVRPPPGARGSHSACLHEEVIAQTVAAAAMSPPGIDQSRCRPASRSFPKAPGPGLNIVEAVFAAGLMASRSRSVRSQDGAVNDSRPAMQLLQPTSWMVGASRAGKARSVAAAGPVRCRLLHPTACPGFERVAPIPNQKG